MVLLIVDVSASTYISVRKELFEKHCVKFPVSNLPGLVVFGDAWILLEDFGHELISKVVRGYQDTHEIIVERENENEKGTAWLQDIYDVNVPTVSLNRAHDFWQQLNRAKGLHI